MRKILVILSLFTSLFIHASFTINGTTITQVAGTTDNQISFITAMQSFSTSGVNVYTYGNTTHSTFYVIDFGNNSLHIEGDFDLDFNRMQFVFRGTDATARLYVKSTANFYMRSPQTSNGITFNPEMGQVWFAVENNTVNWNSQTFRVDAGANAEFIGVNFKGEFSSWLRGTVLMENCIVEKIGNDGDIQFNVENAVTLKDVKMYASGQTGVTFRSNSTNVVIDNVQVYGARDSFNNESSFNVTIEKLDSDTGAIADISQFGGRRHIVKNAKNGTRFVWANHLNGGNPTNYNTGLIEVLQTVLPFGVDGDGNGVDSFKFYMEDNPINSNVLTTLVSDGLTSNTKRVYEITSNASGTILPFDVIIGAGQSNRDGLGLNGTIQTRGFNTTSGTPNTDDVYVWSALEYNKNLATGSSILKGVDGTQINVIFSDDTNITEPSKLVAAAYAGIGIDHTSKTITISQNRTLCDVYDYAKALKVDNMAFPAPGQLTIEALGDDLFFNDYQLVITGTAVLSPCDKFTKVISTVASSIADLNVNLKIALTDAITTYKLVQLSNIINGDVVMTDENTNTIITQELDFTGTINLVTQNNSTNVSVVVSRDGYSNWAVSLDLTSADVFALQVNQSEVIPNALLSKQEDLLYLLRKILQKNQAIQSVLNDDIVPTINLNSVLQNVEYASDEKQDEMLMILKRILSKTQAIRTTVIE